MSDRIEVAIKKQFSELVAKQNRTFDAFPPDRRTMLPSEFELATTKPTECQVLFRHKALPLAVEMRRDTVFHPWELEFTVG